MIAIGIDLGTTFSVVAYYDGSASPRVIPAPDGRAITPSVLFFDHGRVTVGAEAVALGLDDPDRVVRGIKRHMGTRFALAFDGIEYTPESASALILRALVDNAAEALGCAPSDLAAVVTVPAYFGVTEREATAQAARLAGLELLDLVAEPVAAAACYGAHRSASDSVLVVDLGGGTFDTTVLSMTPNGPKVSVTDGDSRLGGLDWSDRLFDLLLTKFLDASADVEEAQDDTAFLEQVADAAEKAKIALTNRDSVPVPLEYDGARITVSVSRAEFEESSAHLVGTCLTVADRAWATAREHGARRLDRVLLVGGATRMPMIRAALEAHFGVEVTAYEPDLAVAKGAAIHANSLVTRSLPGRTAPVRTVLPRAIGILIHDSRDPSGDRRVVDHIVEANTALPVAGALARFATLLDGQDRIRVEVYEQAGAVASPELAHNRRVLDGELVDVPRLRAGSPIDIRFDIGADGRISCTATEPKSGKRLVLESYMEGVIDAADSEQQRVRLAGLRVQW